MSRRALDPAAERYVSLATFRRSGAEVRTPVWIAADPSDPDARRSFVYTNQRMGKVKRIRANGRARLAACDLRGKLRGDFVEARARVVADAATTERGFAALVAKYGWQMRVGRFFGQLSGRWKDAVILEITLEKPA